MAERVSVFVSSSMKELRNERQRLKQALEEVRRIEACVFEEDIGARTLPIQQVYYEAIENAHLYVGIFWKKYGKWTVDEYRHAAEVRKDRLVFVKEVDDEEERDPELRQFLDEIETVTGGITAKRFTDAEDLAESAGAAVEQWVVDVIRSRHAEVADLQPPPLLVDQCDRDRQKMEIAGATKGAVSTESAKRLVVIVDGHVKERHRRFVELLAKQSIPSAIDKNATSVLDKPVNWPEAKAYSNFRSEFTWNLSQAWLERGEADPEVVAGELDAHKGPILIHTHVPAADLGKKPGRAIGNFVRFWREWPARRRGELLFAFLCIQYPDATRGGLARFFGRAVSREHVQAAVNQIAEAGAGEDGGSDAMKVALHVTPELLPVAQSHAENWAENRDVKAWLGSNTRSVNEVQNRIQRLYEEHDLLIDDDRIRMGILADRLEDILVDVRRHKE